ncbi:hypothetical protein PDIG_87430 [Penicillium digitatum PHI26]|uniref:Uncharacterized protein n=2 Tax=Penicillium digitatum TaxID=36651 RepID=K9FUI4_PEND2|nr:hypothetical protein PDIP_33460 [Penicillium digitatum Pd1]EKV04751.1 hypothetical protein PDIG_87430 [Penicillium digitatum PHI26]EKV16979.1 hypothetical protein PDIP_33460 [Penicillium digitatum Pd1]
MALQERVFTPRRNGSKLSLQQFLKVFTQLVRDSCY